MRKMKIIYRIVLFSLAFLIFITNACASQKEEEKERCATAMELKNVIMNFINYRDEAIYEEKFLVTFSENNEKHNDSYFLDNKEDIRIYCFLGDSSLVQDLNTDERAMKLLVDLYLLNKNNAELSEYYGSKVIPKAALRNTEFFVKVIAGKTEEEANQCIRNLKNVQQNADKEKIRNAMAKIDKAEYEPVVKLMEGALQ